MSGKSVFKGNWSTDLREIIFKGVCILGSWYTDLISASWHIVNWQGRFLWVFGCKITP